MRVNVNQFGFRKSVRVAFTEGDCWRLAQYLRDRTGWDMVALGWAVDNDQPCDRYWEHMAVQMPDGRIVDITGAHAPAAMLRLWCGDNNSNYGQQAFYVANDPAYLTEVERYYRNPVQQYGEAILNALGAV